MVVKDRKSQLPTSVNLGSPRAKRLAYLTLTLKSICSLLAGLFISLQIGHYALELGKRFDLVAADTVASWTVDVNTAGVCPQVSALYPQNSDNAETWTEFGELLETQKFKELAIEKLSGLIQIPSESYDNMPPPGEDPRWETMGQVHDYLAVAFPLIHSTFSLTKINTYGLIYELTGSDSSLKPYLLAAHQDVVPVNPETLDSWKYPPYSGFYDAETGIIWGRGASDDKASLAGIMLTLETLLEKGWSPKRTAVLAFGFDEEASGIHGAKSLGKALEETYGQDGIAFIVDEGGGFKDVYGTIFATPGVAEKGHADIKVEVTSPGGHSSIPPTHTTIGYLASIIVAFEKNPFPVELVRNTVPHDTLLCYASHGDAIPHSLKHAIFQSTYRDAALREVEDLFVSKDHWYSSLVGTTQAVDMVFGGVKANALPESAYAIVNHRINTVSSVNETATHDTQTITSLARSFNLTLKAFGEEIISDSAYFPSGSKGHIELSQAFDHELEPAPRTPTFDKGSKPWEFLSGTIKATYNAHRNLRVIEGEESNNIIVSPGMSTGNTDTKYYWNLTRHIFRYNHKNGAYGGDIATGVHTVNENIPLDHYLEMIRFFSTLILNADEAASF
ncbi:carboxypeptidase S [Lentinula aciculospora]|uniref:Carboxypeptidase S n=1 Tax=Lentinula aciculospora TaxID=153920 RepID=A0A9W9AFU7_9AGAR|nr:carboxypeptidase S [Lentinula aciculospora]